MSDELRNDIRVQMDKVDDFRYHLESDTDQNRYRIRCLSDVTNRTREAVYVAERHANDLKDHLAQILVRLGDRSFLELKDEADLECERQLENINSLKSLYNERLKVLNELRETAVRELAETRVRLDHSLKKCECLEDDLKKADEKVAEKMLDTCRRICLDGNRFFIRDINLFGNEFYICVTTILHQ